MKQVDCIFDWLSFPSIKFLFLRKIKKHNNYLCNFPPVLISEYIALSENNIEALLFHFFFGFFRFFLTQKQSSIPLVRPCAACFKRIKSLSLFLFFLCFSLSLSLSKCSGGRKTVRKEGRKGAMLGDSPFHSIQRSWTLEACKAKQSKALKTKHRPFFASCHLPMRL